MNNLIAYIILSTIFLISPLYAQYKTDRPTNISPITDIGSNTKEIFTGRNLLYPAAAIGLTYLFVETGIDAEVLDFTARNQNRATEIFSHAGLYSGYLAPIIVPSVMYFSSKKNSDLRTASYAVMQSVGLSVAIGTVLKAITGRKPPQFDATDKETLSKEFQFGFLNGGIHYGWPSGHMMVNTAMATTLAAMYPEKKWLKYSAVGYVMFMASSIIMHGEAHWFSEVVAGTLFGYLIGKTVGDNFKLYRNDSNGGVSSFSITPVLGSNFNGVSFSLKL